MIKVLIVDDEVLVRVGIKSSIAWQEHGFELVGEAGNGIDALQIIAEQSPDILITDIKMPKMNGIELLKELEKSGRPIQTIILSCYNEFEYVREAMKHGAKDYILKLSMEPKELLEILLKLKADISKNQQTILDKGQELNISLDELKLQFFHRLLNESYVDKEQVLNIIRNLKMCFGLENMLIARIHVDNYSVLVKNQSQNTVPMPILILNMLKEQLTAHRNGEMFHLLEGEFVLILNEEKQTIKLIDEISKVLQKYLNISVSFGISEVFNDFKKMKEYFTQAEDTLENKFFTGNSSINWFKELVYKEYQASFYPLEMENLLFDMLSILKRDETKGIVANIMNDIANRAISKKRSLESIKEILNTFVRVAKAYGGKIYEINSDIGGNAFEAINMLETIQDIKIWFIKYVDNFIDYIEILKSKQCRTEINEIKDYIHVNYEKNIDLNFAAAYVNMSTTHFSTVFKKETGTNFIDYLTGYRMEKAKKLLINDDSLIYEISELVGYSNSNYFSKLFKKYTGVSPEEYKKGNSIH